ncbi:MAG: hypothetical protein AAGU05_16990, partial [Anaerolineaceae bacterium]
MGSSSGDSRISTLTKESSPAITVGIRVGVFVGETAVKVALAATVDEITAVGVVGFTVGALAGWQAANRIMVKSSIVKINRFFCIGSPMAAYCFHT